ncbi:carbonic anhydrase [Mycena polygramma]|nr:carbonic anhydrase [Mycena polygramma]
MIAQEFIEANAQYANAPDFVEPKIVFRDLIIVTCMDPRIQPYEQWGMKLGGGAIVRTAGGSAKDAMSSIAVAQRVFGVSQIAIVHHTDCGMTKFTPESVREKVKETNPGRDDVAKTIDSMYFHSGFYSIEESMEGELKFLMESPLVVKGTKVTGWILDLTTGKISQVADLVV